MHDLHLRLFRAFASLGFDDHRWFSTSDLNVFVTVGAKEELAIQVKLQDARTKLAIGSSQGFKHGSEETRLKDEVKKQEESLQELANHLGPYRDELRRRGETENNSATPAG